MSNLEQQGEELEVLLLIFPDEFAQINNLDELPKEWHGLGIKHFFRLSLNPNDLGDSQEAHGKVIIMQLPFHFSLLRCCTVSVDLLGAMPPKYPENEPLMTNVRNLKGLSGEQIEELQEVCINTAAESIGPSVYNVAIAVQEWLSENNTPGSDGSMYAEMLRREQKKEVGEKKKAYKAAVKLAADSETRDPLVDKAELERQQRRQAGHPVTRETFLAWKEKFDAEKLQLSTLKLTTTGIDESKPSGKQWFLAQEAAGRLVEDEEEAKLLADGENDDFVLELAEDYEDEDDSDYVEGEDEDEGDDEEDDYEEKEIKPSSKQQAAPTKKAGVK